MCTCVVGRTDAGVVVDAVDAGGVVLTVVVLAVVRVHLTTLALEAWRAHTAVHTHTKRRRCKTVTGARSEHAHAHTQHGRKSISLINQLLSYFSI